MSYTGRQAPEYGMGFTFFEIQTRIARRYSEGLGNLYPIP